MLSPTSAAAAFSASRTSTRPNRWPSPHTPRRASGGETSAAAPRSPVSPCCCGPRTGTPRWPLRGVHLAGYCPPAPDQLRAACGRGPRLAGLAERIPHPHGAESYCQKWCTESYSCGGSAVLDELYSIVELDSLDDLGEVAEAAEPAPGFLRAGAHLVDHRQHGLSGDAALGSRGAMADRGEGRFDDVGGSKVRPVRGGEVEEREQFCRGRAPGRRWPWGTCRRSARATR